MDEITDKERLIEFERIIELSKSGYGGTLRNGNIVDRRQFPEAYPIQENSMFGVPKPKDISKFINSQNP